MPIYIAFALCFSMANIALPGTIESSCRSISNKYQYVFFLLLEGGWLLCYLTEVAFGNIKIQYMNKFPILINVSLQHYFH